MIVLKIIGLSALMFAGLVGLHYLVKGIGAFLNHPKVDGFLNPPIKPYNYKPEELWEPPVYWKNWKKTN